ncbi:MAG TPA: S8 family serine peptidase [Ohtaekwangia sp.]
MEKQKFILLPVKTTLALRSEDKTINPKVTNFFGRLSSVRSKPMRLVKRLDKPLPVKVIDSVHEQGAKLVELSLDKLPDFQMAYPGMRLVPEVFYKKAIQPPQPLNRLVSVAASTRKKTILTVTDETGVPVKGASVYAYSDVQSGSGVDGKTNSKGKFTISLPGSVKKLEQILIYPPHSYWPSCSKNVSLNQPITISLQPIDVNYEDGVRHFYKTSSLPVIQKDIKVGVIDTGVGPHASLKVEGGACTIPRNRKSDYKDVDNHGTHVAGIIASTKDPIGVAPGVKLYAYRVFPKNGDASNYSIMKAISQAVDDGCLLINLSLGMDEADEATNSQIADAYSRGVICFAATGNEGRQPVFFPAAYSLAIAVTAMGRKGTFPPNTEPIVDVKAPYGKDKKNFVAAFSNIGPQVKMTAPGVGIISCYPGNKFQVLSGTSMACPAATGIAARLLAKEGKIIKKAPTAQRSDEMVKFLLTKLQLMGFGPRYEGKGMLKV